MIYLSYKISRYLFGSLLIAVLQKNNLKQLLIYVRFFSERFKCQSGLLGCLTLKMGPRNAYSFTNRKG
jgi:hypothetical protein